MNKDIFTSKDYELIAKLLAGEMDEAERDRINKDLITNPERLEAFKEIEETWTDISTPDIFGKIDTDKAWQNFNNRITQKPVLQKSKTFPLWLKWAAGWLLIIIGGALIWFLSQQNKTENNLFTLNTYDENHTLIHTLNDGSVVYLGNNTSFVFPGEFTTPQRKVQITGEAFFDIAHNPLQPFVIETQQVIIEVLGTSFNIKTIESGLMELFVETGSVSAQIKEHTDQSLTVNSGELLIIQDNEMTKTPVYGNYSTAWRKHHMHFKDAKLENIIKVLNQNYPVEFILENNSLKNRQLTVTFYDDSATYIAELISTTLNIEFEQINDSSITFKSKDN